MFSEPNLLQAEFAFRICVPDTFPCGEHWGGPLGSGKFLSMKWGNKSINLSTAMPIEAPHPARPVYPGNRQINATIIIALSISQPTGKRAGCRQEQADAAAEQAAEQADECLLQMHIDR